MLSIRRDEEPKVEVALAIPVPRGRTSTVSHARALRRERPGAGVAQ